MSLCLEGNVGTMGRVWGCIIEKKKKLGIIISTNYENLLKI